MPLRDMLPLVGEGDVSLFFANRSRGAIGFRANRPAYGFTNPNTERGELMKAPGMCIFCTRRPKMSGYCACRECKRTILDAKPDTTMWYDDADIVLIRHGHVIKLIKTADGWHPAYEGTRTIAKNLHKLVKVVDLDRPNLPFSSRLVKMWKGVFTPYLSAGITTA